MNLFAKAIYTLPCLAALGMAAVPVAAVSGAAPFTVDGHSLGLPGVTSWPLLVGDEIATNSASATLIFKDGSSVTLLPKSTLKITGKDLSPIVLVESGSVDYKLVRGSKLSILRLEDAQIPNLKSAEAESRAPSAQHRGLTSSIAALTSAGAVGFGLIGPSLVGHSLVSGGSSAVAGSLSANPQAAAAATTPGADTTDLTVRTLALSKYK